MKRKLLAIVSLFLLSQPGLACKCDDPGTIKEAYEYTRLIIHGKVISYELVSFEEAIKPDRAKAINEKLKHDSSKLALFRADFIVKVEIEIIENFKGNQQTDTVTIYTTLTGASCGYRFKKGEQYIIYASKRSHAYFPFVSGSEKKDIEKENTYWTTHCTRTNAYHKEEAEELRKLSK